MKYFLYCLAACMFIVIIWALYIKRTNGAKFSLAVQIPSLYMTIIFLSLVNPIMFFTRKIMTVILICKKFVLTR